LPTTVKSSREGLPSEDRYTRTMPFMAEARVLSGAEATCTSLTEAAEA